MQDLYTLEKILRENDLINDRVSLKSRYAKAIKDPVVRKIFDLKTPEITDLSPMLEIEGKGKVYAVRYDLNRGVDNHKKHVVAGLILRGVLQGKIPREEIDTFIDGGNFNSAKAVKFYADRFKLRGMYVMSRLFPKEIIAILESDNFNVIKAPRKYDHAREREFYEYLFECMKDREFRKDKFCLWHAKYGGEVSYPFGKEIAEKLDIHPTHLVSCLGAGTTLQGLQIAIQDYFKERKVKEVPRIVVAEHERSPLFTKIIKHVTLARKRNGLEESIKEEAYQRKYGIPHLVLGPHYDEINPLLSRDSINKIDEVVLYSETEWKQIQKELLRKDLSIGNSSAANVSVAKRLANEGNNVLTVIFEPYRDFYQQLEADISSNQDIPWLFRYETPAQKIAFIATSVVWFSGAVCCALSDNQFPIIPF